MSEFGNIDPIIHQAALELGAASGESCRELMRKSGMTEKEILDVFEKAFEWRHRKASPNTEVRQISAKEWGLYVNDILIGTSKARFDADHAKVMLEKALAKSVDL